MILRKSEKRFFLQVDKTLRTAAFSLIAIIIVALIAVFGTERFIPRPVDIEQTHPMPLWMQAHSLLLNMDYEYKTDIFLVVEGDDIDFPLNLIAGDWGIFVHRLKGFSKSFITATPTAELYHLIGDSDLYKWQKAWKLSPSEPTYTIFVKDEMEHLRQDFSLGVRPGMKLPDYFPPGLIEMIENGQVEKLACGAFYYISPEDIYIVHFVAPYPLSDEKGEILTRIVDRMKFGVGEKPKEEQVSADEGEKPDEDPTAQIEPDEPSENPDDTSPDDDGISPLPSF